MAIYSRSGFIPDGQEFVTSVKQSGFDIVSVDDLSTSRPSFVLKAVNIEVWLDRQFVIEYSKTAEIIKR